MISSSSTSRLSTREGRGPRRRGGRAFSLGEELKVRMWARLVSLALTVLKYTTRKRYVGAEGLFSGWLRGERVIVCFWHGRMLMMPFAYRGRGAYILNSAHRDGEIITRAIGRFGITAARGSSTRGWFRGLREMVDAYQRGYDLAVVPDGPRGPCGKAKPGVVQLARATGAAVYPVSFAASRAVTVSTWDRLVVPLPFCRVVYIVGRPITVSPDASPEQRAAKRAEVERRLEEATAEAEALVR